MVCGSTFDPADFESGVRDPADDPPPSEVNILNCQAVKDPDGTLWARFEVTVTNFNYADTISVRYDTANGSGTSSGGNPHYQAKVNQTFTIPPGEEGGFIEVLVHKGSPLHSGTKTFLVNLSVPSNCVLGDDQGQATINYDVLNSGGPPPPPPDGDPTQLTSYVGWSPNGVHYHQFAQPSTYGACTGYAAAAVLSALYSKTTGKEIRFDAKKLFTDAGGTLCINNGDTCYPYSGSYTMKEARDGGADVFQRDFNQGAPCAHLTDTTAGNVKMTSYNQFRGDTKGELLDKIKTFVYRHGAVYLEGQFYSAWNTVPSDGILQDLSGATGFGHAWAIVGWNNNKGGGSVLVQSSHKCDWGGGGGAGQGRAWMPYTQLALGSSGNHWSTYFKGTYDG